MKKLLFLSFIAFLALVGCKITETLPTNENACAVTSFRAAFEQPVPGDEKSRTILGSQSGSSICVNWEENDEVAVIYKDAQASLHKVKFVATPDATDRTKATLTTVEDVDPDWTFQYAFYPDCNVIKYTTKQVTFTLPVTQTYRDGSFAQHTNPAIGKVQGEVIYFQNLCAIVSITLKDDVGQTSPLYYYYYLKCNGYPNFLSSQTGINCNVQTYVMTSEDFSLKAGFTNMLCDVPLRSGMTRTHYYCIPPFTALESIELRYLMDGNGPTTKLGWEDPMYGFSLLATTTPMRFERNKIYVFPPINVHNW